LDKERCPVCGCPGSRLGRRFARWHRPRVPGDPSSWRWAVRARFNIVFGVTSSGARTLDGVAPCPRIERRIEQAAILIGRMHLSRPEAARRLGIDREYLRKTLVRYPGHFEAALARARSKGRPRPADILPEKEDPREPSAEVLALMRKVATTMAAGVPQAEIAAKLEIPLPAIRSWQESYPARWREELEHAMTISAGLVRELAGREAIGVDAAAYLRQARAVQRWATAKGLEIFDKPSGATLAGFFATYYRPVRLDGASPETLKGYWAAVRSWVAITGDPPLCDITAKMLVFYRDRLAECGGRSAAPRRSAASVRSHLSHVQFILQKAGPAGPRNRDAAGLIDQVPWIKLPRATWPIPRVVRPEHLEAAYRMAYRMEVPVLPGIDPGQWWRSLLAVALNLGLRRGTLFKMEWAHIDFDRRRVVLPPEIMKSRRPLIAPLNPTAIAHLLAIRADSGFVFPWPLSPGKFDEYFHRLQDLARIARADHFGLRHERKAFGTHLFEISPAAAQWALGHTTLAVTMKHYVAGAELLARAMDELPQPAAFLERAGAAR